METIKSGNTTNAKPFKIYHVLLPILLGLFVIVWLFLDEFDSATFPFFNFSLKSLFYLILAFLLMLTRDFGMMWRFRFLTNRDLSWRQAFHVNVLSEFTSAVTPAAVGGSSLVVIFLLKEGLDVGRSTTIMFVNLFLDELFFLLFCPLIFIFIPISELFYATSILVSTFGYLFSVLYLTRIIWATILFIGIFKRPSWIKSMLLILFKLPFLRKWYLKVDSLTNNLVQASTDFGKLTFLFWAKAFGMTVLTWSARFLVVNALFMAFVPVHNHLLVFGRQLILWVVMSISPTPGGSGVSEYAFKEYYSDFFSSNSAIIFITLIWRLISYYLYLFLGVLLIPNWIKRKIH